MSTSARSSQRVRAIPQGAGKLAAGIAAASLVASVIGWLVATIGDKVALKVTGGALVVLSWLVYPYFLLLSWALIDPFMGSSTPFVNGSNLDTALTVPSVILLLRLPTRQAIARMPALLPLLAFLVWTLVGLHASPLGHTDFLKQWGLLFDYFAVAVLIITTLSSQRRIDGLIVVMVTVMSLIALWGVWSFLHHEHLMQYSKTPRLEGFYISGPNFGTLLLTPLPLAVYLLYTKRGLTRLFAFCAIVVLITAVTMTFSRGPMAVLVLDALAMAMLLPTVRLRVGSILGAAAALFFALVLKPDLTSRFLQSDVLTAHARTFLWAALLRHLGGSALWGNGMGAGDALLQTLRLYGANGVVQAGTNSPSDLYLTVLYDQGIIGLLLLLLTLVVAAGSLLRLLRRTSGPYRFLVGMCLLSVVNMLILSIEVNSLLLQAVGVYFFAILALPFAAGWSEASMGIKQVLPTPLWKRREAAAKIA